MTEQQKFSFTLKTTDNKARRGEIFTAHGKIQTPAFMPVGTQGTVKAMKIADVENSGAEIILGNTYHLMLRPGADLVAEFGGLHKFIGWDGPILTDSGGFQVMSLGGHKVETSRAKNLSEDQSGAPEDAQENSSAAKYGAQKKQPTQRSGEHQGLCKISDDGVEFSSHIDGTKHFLTPEKSIEIQHKLGADITMIFDECVKYPATYDETKKAMERSLAWAQRSKNAFVKRNGYGLFGIVQGGVHEDLRKISADELVKIEFDGYAIGGLAVGEGQEVMLQVLDYAPNFLPQEKPRYLMGVGKPSDIVGAVARGIDMFDCVLPTRSGRTGQAFVREGKRDGVINIRNAKYRNDPKPLDEKCGCYACKHHSRAYLYHLHKAEEILASMLITEHNIFYYQDLMRDIRTTIEEKRFAEFAREFFRSQN